MAKELRIPVLRIKQGKFALYMTAVRAADLARFTRVDKYDPKKSVSDKDQGYQRDAEMPRVKKFSNWIRKTVAEGGHPLVPTSVLLSSRDLDLQYDDHAKTITLRSDRKLHVVDGQHRTRGFDYAINEQQIAEVADLEIPVIIVTGLEKLDEMQQFAIVNGTQKSVRTDLVNMILAQLAAKKGDSVIAEKDHWKVVVTNVVGRLNEDPKSPWHQMILLPNEAANQRDPGDPIPMVRATSFMTSLKPVHDYLKSGFFEGMSSSQRTDMMANVVLGIWSGLRRMNPTCFRDPHEYVLQKTPGLFSIHSLAVRSMPTMHLHRIAWTEAGFVQHWDPCVELSTPDFWHSKDGDASRYGSMKGFSDLADLLWESLQS